MSDSKQSVVITGCGWITPFHAGPSREIIAQSPGAAPPGNQPWWSIPRDDRPAFLDLPAECAQDDLAFLPAAALRIARKDAGFDDDRPSPPSERVGLVLGAALAGQAGMIDFADDVRAQSPRFVSPIRFPQTVGNFVAGALARGFDIRGPNLTLANGIASGLDAIIEAAALLRSKQADLVYAGGSERWTSALTLGMTRPGTMLSDGVCLFALQREDDARRRKAPVRARIVPDGSKSDMATAFALTSCAGVREPGAVWIEAWIGHCMAALGAAAVAAGIEAASGAVVPYLDPKDATRVEHGSLRPNQSDARLTVVAGDGPESTTVQFLVTLDSRE